MSLYSVAAARATADLARTSEEISANTLRMNMENQNSQGYTAVSSQFSSLVTDSDGGGESTGSDTDLSISGNGFFRVQDNSGSTPVEDLDSDPATSASDLPVLEDSSQSDDETDLSSLEYPAITDEYGYKPSYDHFNFDEMLYQVRQPLEKTPVPFKTNSESIAQLIKELSENAMRDIKSTKEVDSDTPEWIIHTAPDAAPGINMLPEKLVIAPADMYIIEPNQPPPPIDPGHYPVEKIMPLGNNFAVYGDIFSFAGSDFDFG